MDKKIKNTTEKAGLITTAKLGGVLVIIGIVGTVYFGYPMWSFAGIGIGIFLGEWIAYKKFGPGSILDTSWDIWLFLILALGFVTLVLILITSIYPNIASVTIETIEAIALLIASAITIPTIRYFRTRKQR